MPPEYVRPYVKAQKNDGRDAEAIAEATTRPTLRLVDLNSETRLDIWLSLAGSANLDGTGNLLDNRIDGNKGRNRLTGGAGADTDIGGAGEDTVGGRLGAVRLSGDLGADRFVLQAAADRALL